MTFDDWQPGPINRLMTALLPAPQSRLSNPRAPLPLPQPDAQPESYRNVPGALFVRSPDPQPAPAAQLQAAPSAMDKFTQGWKDFDNSTTGKWLNNMFSGWAQGSSPQDSIAKGGLAVQNGKRENMTVKMLMNNGYSQEDAEAINGNRDALNMALGNIMRKQDPAYALQTEQAKANLAKTQAETTALGAKPVGTPLMQNLAAAGLTPGTPEYQKAILAGTKGGVNVDARNMGSIPPGYHVLYDANNNPVRMEAIPGGPADTSKADAAKQDDEAITSDIVTNAAEKAREIAQISGRLATGIGGQVLSHIGESQAAELRRQVGVLTANAKTGNLQVMRNMSKTGGALGNVSNGETMMLAQKAGAIDPDANPADFAKQLEDYERTMLHIVHGHDAGEKFYQDLVSKRGKKSAASTPTASGDGAVDFNEYFKK